MVVGDGCFNIMHDCTMHYQEEIRRQGASLSDTIAGCSDCAAVVHCLHHETWLAIYAADDFDEAVVDS